MKVLTKFQLSAFRPEQFPRPELPEIAFLGRSNVGKSSLINSLVGAKIAKTSNTPGRTQAINFFELRWPGKPRPELIFADLPGYGFARAPREVTRSWPEFIDPYLTQRESLALCLCLVDANIPPQAADTQLIDFLRHHDRRLLVVATKSDRVGNKLPTALKELRMAHGVNDILPYSSRNGAGYEELWRQLRQIGQQATAAR